MVMLNDTIAVTLFQEEEVKVGSIYVTETNPFEKGTVEFVPMQQDGTVAKSDVVLFNRGAGNDVIVDGVRYRFISIRDIKAIL